MTDNPTTETPGLAPVRLGTAVRNGEDSPGVYVLAERLPGKAVDLSALLENAGQPPVKTMIEFLEAGAAADDVLRTAALEGPVAALEAVSVDENELTWLAPIPRPGQILCSLGNNPQIDYEPDNEQPWPRSLYFIKSNTSVIGPGATVEIPDGIGVVQPEAEFCAVIGKRTKLVDESEVEDYIYGYTMLNDITAAGLSLMEITHLGVPMEGGRKERFTFRPMARYKGMDTFAPMGPHIVPTWAHTDPINDPITTRLNGTVVQQGSMKDQRFQINEVVAGIAAWITLEPGDVVSNASIPQHPDWPLRKADLRGSDGQGTTIEVGSARIGQLVNECRVVPAQGRDSMRESIAKTEARAYRQ
ncbi:fumarylacetoacetate hydrolase family protein [Nocardioides sp. NPDC127514]|uniref:fumarylacetoacetate hydrolase family protein n=1 Tax=unclassified Nocardioides TaxID=2615069 RepID=UPI00332E53F7